MKRVSYNNPAEQLPALTPGNSLSQQLENDGFIVLPEHEYAPKHLEPELVVAFASLASHLKDIFHNRPGYPNARLFPSPNTTSVPRDAINFILAWGNLTDQPLPRQHKVSEYFTKMQLVRAKHGKKSLHREMMDAHGIAGRLQLDEKQPMVSLYSKSAHNTGYEISTLPFVDYSTESTTELASHILVANPLRFHSAIKYIPWNGYIGNVFYPDDESHIL